MACCIFKGCFNKQTPFGTVTFFNLPNDEPRRGRWLFLSGNEDVQNLPANARRLVCEQHFEERFLRRQFHRTTLVRDALPLSHLMKKVKLATGAEKILIEETQENIKIEEPAVTGQEEVLLIADEETEYEVLVEEMPCEESEIKEESNEDHETHLIEVEESYDDGHEVIDTTQNIITGDGSTLIRCREDPVVFDSLPQESKDAVDTILIDFEDSCEEHKSEEIVENIQESQPKEDMHHEHVVEEKSHDLVETIVPDEVESSENHDENSTIDNITDVSQPEEKHENVVVEPEPEAKEVVVSYSKPQAKHKLPLESTQETKKFKHDEVVEPDTSSQRDAPRAPVVTIGQPSTSSCTSSSGPASAPAPGKMCEEEYFALSLVGPLQRLPPERRAIAKMKILTYLVQLECGMTDASL